MVKKAVVEQEELKDMRIVRSTNKKSMCFYVKCPCGRKHKYVTSLEYLKRLSRNEFRFLYAKHDKKLKEERKQAKATKKTKKLVI